MSPKNHEKGRINEILMSKWLLTFPCSGVTKDLYHETGNQSIANIWKRQVNRNCRKKKILIHNCFRNSETIKQGDSDKSFEPELLTKCGSCFKANSPSPP